MEPRSSRKKVKKKKPNKWVKWEIGGVSTLVLALLFNHVRSTPEFDLAHQKATTYTLPPIKKQNVSDPVINEWSNQSNLSQILTGDNVDNSNSNNLSGNQPPVSPEEQKLLAAINKLNESTGASTSTGTKASATKSSVEQPIKKTTKKTVKKTISTKSSTHTTATKSSQTTTKRTVKSNTTTKSSQTIKSTTSSKIATTTQTNIVRPKKHKQITQIFQIQTKTS